MAFKRKLKRRVRKRVGKRKFRKSDTYKLTTRYVPSIQQLFPDRLITRLRNRYFINIAGTANTAYAGGILGNALHNPIAAVQSGANVLTFGSGSSMVGLAQILGAGGSATSYAYSQYRIHSSSIKMEIQMDEQNQPVEFVIFPTSEETTLGTVGGLNLQTLQEYPYSKCAHIMSTMNRGVTVKNRMTTAKMYGLKYKAAIEDPAFAGAGGTNPVNQWGWVWFWDPDLSTGTNAATINVEVIYTIEFFNRSLQALGSG